MPIAAAGPHSPAATARRLIRSARARAMISALPLADRDRERVEEGLVQRRKAEPAQPVGEDRRSPVNAARDVGEAIGAVINRIHRGDYREQHLRGADVRGRLLAPDMLLAGLQGEAIGRRPARIDGEADDASRHVALEVVAHRHIGRMRPAKAHRHAESLGGADRDVGAEFAGWHQQRQRQRVRREDRKAAARVNGRDRVAVVADGPKRVGILKERTKNVRAGKIVTGASDHEIDPERLGADLQHRERLRMHVAIHKERRNFRGGRPMRQRHRFRRRRRLVKQRGVRDRQPGQVGDHGLEVHQGFQPALADLRLIRRISRVPTRIFQDIPLDDRRQDSTVIALPDERGEHLVLARNLAHAVKRRPLGKGGCKGERPPSPDRGRNHFRDQGVKAFCAHRRQHGVDVTRVRTDVPLGKGRFARINLSTVRSVHAYSSLCVKGVAPAERPSACVTVFRGAERLTRLRPPACAATKANVSRSKYDIGRLPASPARHGAPSVLVPENVIPSADARGVTFQIQIPRRSFCLRVSGAVAPSASVGPISPVERTPVTYIV